MLLNSQPIVGSYNVVTTGVPTGSLANLTGQLRAVDEFSVQAKGYGTQVITPAYLNGGFETAGGGGADPFTEWTEATAGGTVIADDTVSFHGGAHSAKITVDASHNIGSLTQAVLTIGQTYTVSLYAKSTVAGAIVEVVNGTTVEATHTLTTSYVEYTVTFVAVHANLVIRSKSIAANDNKVINIDDVTVTDSVAFSRVPTNLAASLEVSLDGTYFTEVQAIAETDDAAVLFEANVPTQIFRFNVTALTLVEAEDYVTLSVVAA